MRIFISVFVLFLCSKSVFSQQFTQGEATLKNGEKIIAFFEKDQFMQDQIKYRISLDGELKYLKAKETKDIYVDSIKSFVSKLVYFSGDSVNIFAKVIVSGKYSLYEGYIIDSRSEKQLLYIAEKNDKLYAIPAMVNTNFFKQLYGDCAIEGISLYNKVKIFNAEVTAKANLCENIKPTILFIPKPANFYLGYNLGFSHSLANKKPEYLKKNIQSNGLYGGVNIQLIQNDKILIESGLNLALNTSRNIFIDQSFITQYDSLNTNFNFVGSYLEIPVMIGFLKKVKEQRLFVFKVGLGIKAVDFSKRLYVFDAKSQYANKNFFLTKNGLVVFKSECAYRINLKQKKVLDIVLGYTYDNIYMELGKLKITQKPISAKHNISLGVTYLFDKAKKTEILK